ncbi:hypothetical protein GF362_05325 [Candidatus Dojkabacteria bacterium]|nr:hypothetical protein [Candidatus Dojkabacteria bacterium]
MANIFGQMGDLYKLQKEARKMKKKMKKMSVSGFSKNEDVEVVIDGTQEILEIGIEDELLDPAKKEYLIKGLKKAFKDAQKKLQKDMSKDMDIDQLKGMLG